MNHLEGTKSDAKITLAVASNATHSHEIDTLGYEYLSADVVISTYSTTVAAYANVLKLQQSDTAGSGQVDMGLSVTAGQVVGTSNTKVGAIARFNVDLKAAKRYVTVVCTPGGTNTQAVASVARLARGNDMPINATAAGVNAFVSG